MTTVAPVPLSLYHSPWGLLDCQAEAVARCYLRENGASLPLFDKGLGKTHIAMALASLLVQDGMVDRVVVVAEATKVSDFAQEDFPRFTDLRVAEYAGTPARRARVLEGDAQVLVTSYETGRNDICQFKRAGRAVVGDGPLTDHLRGLRVLVVFDEVTKLRNRGSKVYLAWDYLINRVLRRRPAAPGPHVWVVGLTASTVRRSPEDHANIARLLDPSLAPRVGEFDRDYVARRDDFGNAVRFKNITPATTAASSGVSPLVVRLAPLVIRKRKTDPDVLAQFPRRVEAPPTMVEPSAAHRELLDAIVDMIPEDAGEMDQRQQFNLLRMAVNHPAALARAQGRYARALVDAVGEALLREVGSAKVDAMLRWAAEAASQQGVLFTFFGPSCLPLLSEVMRGAGYSHALLHSGVSRDGRAEAQRQFKAGEVQFLLSSDAGARGLNLGCGSVLLHYEPPTDFDTYDQRCDRISRLDSVHPSVTIDTLVARDTPDVGAYGLLARRQGWTEQVLDGDAGGSADGEEAAPRVSAKERRRMLAQMRNRRRVV